MKDLSHGFLANRRLVHSRVMGLGNPLKAVVNWRDDWSWLLGWVSYGECTSVYGYTLDRTCGES